MMQRQAEDLTKTLWKVINNVCKATNPPYIKTKRAQLRVINEAIAQFESNNIPVPDDFPSMKQAMTEEIERADKEQLILFFLRDQLSQMLDAIEGHLQAKNLEKRKEKEEAGELE